MPQLTSRRSAVGARRGLSLIELLITMTVLAIVGASLTSILTRQQRFYRDAAEKVEVRRELRGGAALVPADLRALSTIGGDLIAASGTTLEIRASIGSAVVCAKPSNTTLHLVPLNTTTHTLTSWYTAPQAGDAIFIFNDSSATGAEDDKWSPHTLAATPALPGDATRCAGSPYVAAVDAALPKVELSVTPNLSPFVGVGSVIRFTRQMRYSFYQPAGASDWYVGYESWNGAAYDAIQPVIGPLRATTGLAFSFADSAGTAVDPSTAAARARITRIGLRMQASGRSDALRARGGVAYTDSLIFKIGVRNYK
jgi:prepilin-type N-terminal cleavage/methylation domain-containing protein